MKEKGNILIDVLYAIGVTLLYLLAVMLVLSSGCFIFISMNSGTFSTAPQFLIPAGIGLGILALFLIRFLARLGKNKKRESEK